MRFGLLAGTILKIGNIVAANSSDAVPDLNLERYGNFAADENSLGQNLNHRMDPRRSQPVKLFDAVMNRVESPQSGHRMKHAMGPNPVRQASDRGLKDAGTICPAAKFSLR
jgi:hypothetical protein